ncbi:YitT family protein [Caniella muris]|uniref:YitT family protein n=1 Tax=Caniella muris TaxID=2941502 RepID=UPI00203E38AA|nr:YitT family protein [Caniella muris]
MGGGVDVRRVARDVVLIVVGSALYAFGVDAFAVPEGLAAGGVTGLATVIYAVGAEHGLYLPVGTQTLIMNGLLMIPVIRTGGLRYAARTIGGIVASSLFIDLFAPVVPPLGGGDLLLCALWGGVICGVGLGLVFRTGGNTGGTDIVAQLANRRLGIPVGTASVIVDALIVLVSIPVFSLSNALYAMVMMYLMCRVLDAVIDGPRSERAAWIISQNHDRIANAVMYSLGRGCTEVSARGVWSGNPKPMLLVILSNREVGMLKEIVSDADPEALMIISEVHEAFGEGFEGMGRR